MFVFVMRGFVSLGSFWSESRFFPFFFPLGDVVRLRRRVAVARWWLRMLGRKRLFLAGSEE